MDVLFLTLINFSLSSSFSMSFVSLKLSYAHFHDAWYVLNKMIFLPLFLYQCVLFLAMGGELISHIRSNNVRKWWFMTFLFIQFVETPKNNLAQPWIVNHNYYTSYSLVYRFSFLVEASFVIINWGWDNSTRYQKNYFGCQWQWRYSQEMYKYSAKYILRSKDEY